MKKFYLNTRNIKGNTKNALTNINTPKRKYEKEIPPIFHDSTNYKYLYFNTYTKNTKIQKIQEV